jgi:hypothetical protein
MSAVHFEPPIDDERRRQALYEGDIIVYGARPSSLALCRHAAQMIEEAFGGRDPRTVQHEIPVEEFAAIAAPLKSGFIHHPESKRLIANLLLEMGCDPDVTYFDVPRLRMATSDGYLTSGVAYAHHPHRDTWYSAPMCQINWWLPIYPIRPDNAMAFHPRYFREGVPNDSDRFNYYEWNANQRRNAAQHVKSDTRWQPHASVPLELEPDIRLLPEVGGMILFSAAHMHSTVPNTSGVTRWSIDFRTVALSDVVAKRGARNVDSHPSGTSLRDFMRLRDRERIDETVVAPYDQGARKEGELLFQPT